MSSRGGLFAVSSVAVLLLLAALPGCGGDDGDDGDDKGKRPAPVAGTFVGKVPDSEALVAVVAAPPTKGEDRRQVTAFICDAKRLCTWFSGSTNGNGFVAKSEDGEAKGSLTGKAAKGRIELPDGKSVRYNAREATATAGLYDLTVSRRGKVSGASAAGVALKGEVTLPPSGSGKLKLADGSSLKLEVRKSTAGDATRLRAGQVRLIVLPDGELSGAGRSRRGGSEFFIRSS